MDPKRKVTILKGTTSEEIDFKMTSFEVFSEEEEPQPSTSGGIFKIPKPPKIGKRSGAENSSEDAVVKRMRIGRNIRKVTPEDLEDFPEGIVLKASGNDVDVETKPIFCTTPTAPKDEDVLIIDVSEEEIADILDEKPSGDEPNNCNVDAEQIPFCLIPRENEEEKAIENTEGNEKSEDANLEKDPNDPRVFDIIDLTTDDDLDEHENLHARLIDKYVEGLAEERFAPDFKGYKAKSLRLRPKSPESQDLPEEVKQEDNIN